MGWTGTHDGTAADILERLRVFNPCADADWFATIRDAMSEIERLRADLAGAKAAAGTTRHDCPGKSIACAACGGTGIAPPPSSHGG